MIVELFKSTILSDNLKHIFFFVEKLGNNSLENDFSFIKKLDNNKLEEFIFIEEWKYSFFLLTTW